MKNKIIIYVIVQFLLILCSIFVIPNVEGVLSIFTVLIVIVGNVLNLIFLLKAKNAKRVFEHYQRLNQVVILPFDSLYKKLRKGENENEK